MWTCNTLAGQMHAPPLYAATSLLHMLQALQACDGTCVVRPDGAVSLLRGCCMLGMGRPVWLQAAVAATAAAAAAVCCCRLGVLLS